MVNEDAAAEVYELHYSGDVLPDKTLRRLTAIFAQGLPAVPERPMLPDLE